jgi:RNA polymerase sigma factor (sigma-70 family)
MNTSPPTTTAVSLVDEIDSALLASFAAERDEAAFAELVRRHFGLVMGVCRRVLRNSHDIEDVFQATFLVLARDAKRIREHHSLSHWLYGVAYRLALMVTRQKVRRREAELTESIAMARRDVVDDLVAVHDQHLFDEELNSLPEKYREPLVLHYLAGRTQQQVADELGLTIGAVDGLLKRGRKELRQRLTRRGVAIGAALAAVQASQHVAHAADMSGMVTSTTQASIAFTSNTPTAGAFSRRAAELAGKELAKMSMTTKTVLMGLTLGAGTMLGGIGLAYSFAAQRPSPDLFVNPESTVVTQPALPPTAVVLQEFLPVPPVVEELPLAVDAQAVDPPADQIALNKDDASTDKYTNADEAYGIGAAMYNAGNIAGSRDPFEAALKMAPDDKFRIKVYRALIASYRQQAEIDKFVEAMDFIITKSDRVAERSLARTDLLSFVHQRGKTNDLAKRYEEVLTKDGKNVTALYILSELYADLKRDPKRSSDLLERLAKVQGDSNEKLNVADSAKLAQQYVKQSKFKEGATLFEKIAPMDEKLAAWHWKEAAQAWIKAKDKPRALKAAKASVAAGPEKRGDLLLHFWHRALGQVFLETGEPMLAAEHFEAAIKSTTIEGYAKDTKAELAKANEMIAKEKK